MDFSKDSLEYQEGANLTKIWDAISYEFFDGWPQDSGRPDSEDEKLIDYFLSRETFTQILIDFINKTIVNTTDPSYSNKTEV